MNITTEIIDQDERILRAADLAALLRLSKTTTYETTRLPDFPAAIQLTPSIRGWLKSEVIAWLKTRRTGIPETGEGQ